MAKIKEIFWAVKEAILNGAYPNRRLPFIRLIDERLIRTQLQDKAYNCKESGITQDSISDHEVVVSLTTHGRRILTVHRAIESIMQQSIHPNRIILYLGANEFIDESRLPVVLRRQMQRGLEVRFVDDIGPYTKLLPALHDFPESNILIFDDDNFYPVDSIERLLMAHSTHPEAICGLLTRTLQLKNHHQFEKYSLSKFDSFPQDTISPYYVAEGVGGVLFPPHSLPEEVFNSEVYTHLAPNADDLWYKAMSLLKGTPVVNVHRFFDIDYERFLDTDVQDEGLFFENLWQGGNDKKLKELFDYYHLWDKL